MAMSPPMHRAIIPPSFRVSVPSRDQKTVLPSDHSIYPRCHLVRHFANRFAIMPTSAPPCHLPPTRRNRVSVTPGAPPWHHRSTMSSAAPLWHLVRHHVTVPTCLRRATVPPYRHITFDISIYLRTPTHLAYFTTHLRPVNYTSVPPDIAGRNFTIWFISKIAMTTLIGFLEGPWVLQ